jgi:hypothetical protein
MKSQIQKVYLKLEADGKSVLSIMLTAGGALNRQGDGSGDPDFDRFFMGSTTDGLFERFMAEVSEEMLEWSGRYELPDPKGERCVLTLAFEGKDIDTGFEFKYGAESEGPPEEFLALFDLATELTDPWYENQLNRNRRN